MKSQEILVGLIDSSVDEEKDTPPKKKLKQARLPFQVLASPVTTSKVASASVSNNKKRRLSSDSDDIQVVKVIKNDSSVSKIESASLTEFKENLCEDPVTKNDVCADGIVTRVGGNDVTTAITNETSNENKPLLSTTDLKVDADCSATVAVIPTLVVTETESNSETLDKTRLSDVGALHKDENKTSESELEDHETLTPLELSECDEPEEKANTDSNAENNSLVSEQMITPKVKLPVQDETDSAKKLTPRQLQKVAEREKLKEEKQKLKQEKEDQKRKEREQKEDQKKKEREQKEDQRKKEKEEKEDQRKKEKEEKEDQRRKEKEDRDRKKQAEMDLKNEEKRVKDEEKRKKEQADEDAKNKIAKKFTSFFVPKKSETKVSEELVPKVEDCQNFKPFQVKHDMRLAPLVRTKFTNKTSMDKAVQNQVASALYLEQLKGRTVRTGGKTWPLSEYKNEVVILEVDKTPEPANDNMLIVTETGDTPALRPKLFQFHENRRPPYWGTWRKRSAHVKPTHPFRKDEKMFDYEADSDDEWEEEEPGESLHGSDDEKEPVDDYEIDNDFFVPHGYLSDEENEGEEEEVMSPETQKAKLKVLEIEFEEEMKHKMERIKPRLLGCFWANKHNDIAGTQLLKLLTARQAVCRDGPIKILLVDTSTPNSPSQADVIAGHSPASGKHSTKKVKLPSEGIPHLVRLIHGNANSRAFLVKEFSAYWSSHGGTHGKELAPGEMLSSRSITNRITELANWMPCLDEGPLLGRMCWYVSQDVREAHGLADLSTPNTWKYHLQPRRVKDSIGEGSASVSPGVNTPKLVPLITNFTKTVTPEERQKQFQQTANGHILPPTHTSTGPKLSLITKFTKFMSQEERESKLKQSMVEKASLPTVTNVTLPGKNSSQTSVPKKRASILVSVARGQEIPKASNNLMDRFVTTSASPSSAKNSEEKAPSITKNNISVLESKCDAMDVDCIVLSD